MRLRANAIAAWSSSTSLMPKVIGALSLPFVPAGDDHGLRRPGLAKMPGAKVDAVRGDELDLLVVRLELEGSEGEVVEPARSRRHERAPVDRVGQDGVQEQKPGDDEARVHQ